MAPKLRSKSVSGPADSANRLRAARRIEQSLMVEASAGTGKTTLLVTRIVNLLLHGRVNGRLPRMDEIVAITFTEKAAGELKSRLRSVLEQAVAEGKFAGIELTANEHSQLRRAVHDLDAAAVTTIHSFCAAMLRERPVEAGIDPLRTVADPLAQQLLLDEAWRRWCEKALQAEDDAALLEPLRLEIKTDRAGANDRSATLRELAETLVENRDLVDFLPAPIDEEREWMVMQRRLEQRCTELEQCLRDARGSDKPARLSREFIAQVRGDCAGSPAKVRAAVFRLSIDKNVGGDARRWNNQESLARLRELLADTRSLISDAQETLGHNLTAALAARLVEFVRFYEDLKAQRGLLDFQDLLLMARDMLRNSQEARHYFRDKLRFLLVDEFQDTDPLQAEIVLLLTSDDGTVEGDVEPGRLFIVGDPKQSIYRFRRADIEIYEQCRQRLGAGNHVTIQQNFRSGSGVIDTVNRLFESLIQRSSDGSYQPDYVPLLPGPRAAESPGCAVLLYPPNPQQDLSGSIGEIRYREGCAIARFIQQAVERQWPLSRGGRLGLGDVAILFTQFTDIERYEDAFRACGLEYHIAGGRHFYERIEIKSLSAVVAAIDNPEAEISVVAALRSPFFGASDEELLGHALAGGRFNYLAPGVPSAPALPAAIVDGFELLGSLHRQRNDRSVAQTLLEFFDATKGLESFLMKPQGEQRVANLLKVVDSVRALERSSVLTWRGFVRWLRTRQESREEESESPRAEAGDPSVQVLTVHKAKGLEFPMTIVAGMNTGKTRPDDRFIIDRVSRKVYLRCGALRNRGWNATQQWDLVRESAERRRLFYVAATRACDYLVLTPHWRKSNGNAEGFQDFIDDFVPGPTEVPWGQVAGGFTIFDTRTLTPWPQIPHAPRIHPDKIVDTGAAERFLQDRATWLQELKGTMVRAGKGHDIVTASQLASSVESGAAELPGPAPAGPDVAMPADSRPARQPISTTARGAAFGSLVHRLLELCLSKQLHVKDVAPAAASLAGEFSVGEPEAVEAAKLVEQAWQSPTIRRLRAAHRLFLEVPFAFAQGDRIIEGRIDAVAQEPAGLVIVDFKTDQVELGGECSLAEQYRPQMQAYAAAIHAVTGSPVHSAALLFLRTLAEVSVPIIGRNERGKAEEHGLGG